MKNKLTLLSITLAGAMLLGGCTTDQYGRTTAAGCDRGTNYAGAGVGAVAGGLAGSIIGGGTGQLLATGAGAAIGGIAGSKSRIGC